MFFSNTERVIPHSYVHVYILFSDKLFKLSVMIKKNKFSRKIIHLFTELWPLTNDPNWEIIQ